MLFFRRYDIDTDLTFSIRFRVQTDIRSFLGQDPFNDLLEPKFAYIIQPESLILIHSQRFSQEQFCIALKCQRFKQLLDLLTLYFTDQLFLVACLPRSLSSEQLEEDDAESPYIGFQSILISSQ